jgi:ketosteroid isomerase-like protein
MLKNSLLMRTAAQEAYQRKGMNSADIAFLLVKNGKISELVEYLN